MSTILILVYFFGLYVAPQDWAPLVKGLPVDWMIYGMLAMAVPFQTGHFARAAHSVTLRLLACWIGIIAISNIFMGQFSWAQIAISQYAPYLVVFASLLLFLSTPTRLRVVIWFALILTAILAYQCIDQVRTGVGWAGQPLGWNDGFGGRAQWVGIWDGPNVLCLLFVIAVPFLFEFLFPPWPWLVRLVALGIFGVTTQGILLTQSRGGFLALGVSLLLATIVRFPSRKAMLPLAVSAMLVMAVAPGRMSEMDDRDGSKSAYYRAEMWSAALTMARESPLLGVGKMRFREYSGTMTGKHLIAHNSFIENLAETGMIGLGVFVGLIYVSLKGLWRLKGKILDPQERSINRALIVSVVGYAAMSVFLTTDFDLFYVQLGLVAAFCATHGEYPTLGLRDLVCIGMLEVALVVALYAFLQLYM